MNQSTTIKQNLDSEITVDMPLTIAQANPFGTGPDLVAPVETTVSVVVSPESSLLESFHAFLVSHFRAGEVEPLETFKQELSKNLDPNSEGRFIAAIVLNPFKSEQSQLSSGAYGSVQNGTLAIRFTLTETLWRSTGMSQLADQYLVAEARNISAAKEVPLKAFVAEAVERSEAYWNRLEIEPANGMRRLYYPGTHQEFAYRIPPLVWNSDGTPASESLEEHLQVAISGHSKTIPTKELIPILKDWWATWYIRPVNQFDSKVAWEKHKQTVETILDEIIKPLDAVTLLCPISRNEREGRV